MYQLKPRQRTVIAAIMLVASFISLMSQTMVVTALPVVEAQLHQPLAVVQWLTTGYTLVIGIITPLSANLYEKYNNRQFFLAIIALFLGGTIVGCLATNFWTLLGARLIQAAAGGLLVSLQMTTLVTIFPPEKRGTIMGLSSLVVSFGPAIGPTLAGVTLNQWGWRSIFWVVLPFMVVIWLVGFFALPAYTTPQAVKIDAWSVPLLLIGPGLTLASFTVLTTQVLIGSLMLIAGLVVSLLFYRRQQALPRPLLDFHVFSYRPFTMTLAIASLMFMILLSTEQMVSVFAQNSLHQSSALTGLILLPGAVVNALVGAVVGRLYDRHGIKALVWTGLGLCLITTVPTLCFSAHTPLWWLTVLYAGRMMAIGIAFSPLMSESYLGMAAKDISQATAMNNALRQMTGALAVTLVVVISSLPTSSVTGMRWAMAVTFVFNLLAIGLFAQYLKGGHPHGK